MSRGRRTVGAGAAVLAAVAALAGCAGTEPSSGATTAGAATSTGEAAASRALPDAAAVVASFDEAGLPAADGADTTAADCGGDVGCSSAITLPAVVVRAFSTSGRAEIYANGVGVFHVVSVALTFGADVPPEQQRAYEAAARRSIP